MSRKIVNTLIALGVVMTACKSDPPAQEPPAQKAGVDFKTGPIEEPPQGSGDYRKTLALVRRYKEKQLTLAQLQAELVGRKLPPWKDGKCSVFLLVPPPPPPGVTFDPRMMPKDWEGTWGEVAHVHLMGELTKDEYEQLHHAAHPAEAK